MSRNFNLNTNNKDEWLTPPFMAADTRILRKAVQDGRITGKLLKCREEKKA